MIKANFTDIDSIKKAVGTEVAVSDWHQVTQEQINIFADATGDHQWIHIDPVRAAKESPYGTTIAHGFLTLSLVAKFSGECLRNTTTKMAINYGANKVRFPAPVKVNSRIRAKFVLDTMEEIAGGVQVQWAVTLEIENQEKPACIAQTLTRWYF
jgi:acyl dehydratase